MIHHHCCHIKLAICTDSSSVFDRVQGKACRWRADGQGPVINVHLWIQLMDLLDREVPVVDWIKVPSHIGIPGKERANNLAEQGRKSSPLYHTVRSPAIPPRSPLCSPPGRVWDGLGGSRLVHRTIELGSM